MLETKISGSRSYRKITLLQPVEMESHQGENTETNQIISQQFIISLSYGIENEQLQITTETKF